LQPKVTPNGMEVHSLNALTAEVLAARRLPLPKVAKAIREGAGVSQARMARALHVHRVTVARWESGDRAPRGELRRQYMELLDELRREVLAQ
jgi:DNA-binding transcriptional regulator YiaG